jgi:hypothetical protein
VHGGIDESRPRELLVESDDPQSEEIKGANAGIADYVEALQQAQSDRRRLARARLSGRRP